MQMLSGCILGSERPDLAPDIPPKYGAGNGESAPPALDWWRGFRSLELTNLIEEAQAANLDIAAAIGRIMQADAQAKIIGAPLLPEVDFTGFAQRVAAAAAVPSATCSRPRSTPATRSISGARTAPPRAPPQETAVATRFDKEVVVLSTIAAVGNSYFLVLEAQDQLRIARQNYEAANRVLTLIKQRFDAGTASQLDVAQQQSLVDQVRANIPLFDQDLRQNIAILAVLIGRPPVQVVVKGGSLFRLSIPRVTPGLPSELLFQRPDIRAAEADLASADASVESARAAFFPSISLTGQGGYQSNVLKLLFTPQNAFYNLAVNVTQPLFDGFRLEGQLELTQGPAIRAAEDLLSDASSPASATWSLRSSPSPTGPSASGCSSWSSTSSREAFKLAETRLREGTVDLVTVLQTQQTLFTAENNLVLARFARLQAVLSLFQALGGSWMPPGVGAGGVGANANVIR